MIYIFQHTVAVIGTGGDCEVDAWIFHETKLKLLLRVVLIHLVCMNSPRRGRSAIISRPGNKARHLAFCRQFCFFSREWENDDRVEV